MWERGRAEGGQSVQRSKVTGYKCLTRLLLLGQRFGDSVDRISGKRGDRTERVVSSIVQVVVNKCSGVVGPPVVRFVRRVWTEKSRYAPFFSFFGNHLRTIYVPDLACKSVYNLIVYNVFWNTPSVTISKKSTSLSSSVHFTKMGFYLDQSSSRFSPWTNRSGLKGAFRLGLCFRMHVHHANPYIRVLRLCPLSLSYPK